jgi:hypothetical protein
MYSGGWEKISTLIKNMKGSEDESKVKIVNGYNGFWHIISGCTRKLSLWRLSYFGL